MMIEPEHNIAIEAHPADDEDFDVSEAHVEAALASRRARVGRIGLALEREAAVSAPRS